MIVGLYTGRRLTNQLIPTSSIVHSGLDDRYAITDWIIAQSVIFSTRISDPAAGAIR